MTLNCGCGSEKIHGAINVDVEESLRPDVVSDFRGPLPFASNSVDKIYFFHTIEHIKEDLHVPVLLSFRDVLKVGGELFITYPEFRKCAKNYIENYRGEREFWRRTIYGRQLHKSDYHVALMDTPFFIDLLKGLGYDSIVSKPEPNETYNTMVRAKKAEKMPKGVEDIYRHAFFPTSVST